jgi:hypothetical protein
MLVMTVRLASVLLRAPAETVSPCQRGVGEVLPDGWRDERDKVVVAEVVELVDADEGVEEGQSDQMGQGGCDVVQRFLWPGFKRCTNTITPVRGPRSKELSRSWRRAGSTEPQWLQADE